MQTPHAGNWNTRITGTTATLIALALFAAHTPAGAATTRHARTTTRHRIEASATPAATPAAQGMVVGINPETGRLGMPSREDLLQLSPPERIGLLRSAAGLVAVRLPDGSMMLNLQGRFMDYSIVRLDAAGHPRLGCVDDAAGLARWFGAREPQSAPAPALEVK